MSAKFESMDLDLDISDLNLTESSKNLDLTIQEDEENSDNLNENISEDKQNEQERTGLRRSLRKKLQMLNDIEKRRVLTKPKKILDCNNLNDLRKYYMCKTVKRLPPTLETIFEEGDIKKTDAITGRRLKRVISFSDCPNIGKVRKRQMKAKKLIAGRNFLKRKRISMEVFLMKMKDLDSETED